MMTRRVLQELQVTYVDAKRSSKMGGEGSTSESVDGNTSCKNKKQSTVPAKRSKRKNVTNENKPTKTSKGVAKKASKAITQKERNLLEESDLQKTVTLNQSRLESYLCPPGSSTGEISDDSAVQDLGNITVSKSIVEELHLITSETPSQTYWQELAEQRRIALGKTLEENEMLTDQINVLQAENILLKNALEAAETLLKHEGLLD